MSNVTAINVNDTVSYPTAGGGRGTGTVVHVSAIGPVRKLTVLPYGAGHDVTMTDTDVEVTEPALDIVALTAFLGCPEHDQQAVQAWTGERYGRTWSQAEAVALAIIWASDPDNADNLND